MEGLIRNSTTISMLSDREKFVLAKREGLLNVLIELIQSNDNNNRNTVFLGDGSNRFSRKFLNLMTSEKERE